MGAPFAKIFEISDDYLVLWNQLNSSSTLQNKWSNKNKILSKVLDKYIKINNRLYSRIYLHLKNIYTLKNRSHLLTYWFTEKYLG